MGAAIQSVAGAVAIAAGPVFTAVPAGAGDSFSPANFDMSSQGFLHGLLRGGATKGQIRVISPRLHDAVQPISFATDVNPSRILFPAFTGQPVYPADVVTVQLNGTAAEVDVAVLTYYYGNLPGLAPRLHQWADIQGLIANVKTVLVAAVAGAAVGNWGDTLITTTENLLKADRDYAILGYTTDVAVTAVGVKGPDTGNFRIADTGTDFTEDTADVFVQNSMRHNLPWIPVINSNNRAATFVSVANNAAGTAVNVTLVCAELSQKVSP